MPIVSVLPFVMVFLAGLMSVLSPQVWNSLKIGGSDVQASRSELLFRRIVGLAVLAASVVFGVGFLLRADIRTPSMADTAFFLLCVASVCVITEQIWRPALFSTRPNVLSNVLRALRYLIVSAILIYIGVRVVVGLLLLVAI